MRRLVPILVVVGVLASGCSERPGGRASDASPRVRAVTLLFGGDVMLGRGVAPVAADDPWSIFEGLRTQISAADFAVANLESPLTRAPHVAETLNALEADPRSARILAAAGFGAMTIANNHASDAGPATPTSTASALRRAGVDAAGLDAEPVLETRNGVTLAVLAFDVSPRQIAPTGVARWDPVVARAAMRDACAEADLVAVSLHGGLDYHPDADGWLTSLGTRLARWGADVVWGHGPHVVQPVKAIDPDRDGRAAVLATSLGNLLFDDQGIPGTDSGALLAVRADADGVIAYRVGATRSDSGRVTFDAWIPPEGDAVSFGGGWWTTVRPIPSVPAGVLPTRLPARLGPPVDVVDAAFGDVNGDGVPEVVVAFRWPFSLGSQILAEPDHAWIDDQGRKASVGVYRSDDLAPMWVASSVWRPVVRVVPCGDVLVVAYSTLNDPATVATGLWPWRGFGFTSSVDLPGPGTPGCVDIDADARRDPVVTGRSDP